MSKFQFIGANGNSCFGHAIRILLPICQGHPHLREGASEVVEAAAAHDRLGGAGRGSSMGQFCTFDRGPPTLVMELQQAGLAARMARGTKPRGFDRPAGGEGKAE